MKRLGDHCITCHPVSYRIRHKEASNDPVYLFWIATGPQLILVARGTEGAPLASVRAPRMLSVQRDSGCPGVRLTLTESDRLRFSSIRRQRNVLCNRLT